MNPCPCATISIPRGLKRQRFSAIQAAIQAAILTLLALAALLLAATAALADAALADAAQTAAVQTEDDRGLAPGPARHVLVKAVGQGQSAEEAEQDALRAARRMAARHYAALGGAAALDASPQGTRIVASHHSPPIGFATVRAVVLVELRLRALPEPPAASLALPVLRVSVDAAQVIVTANRPCEAMIAVDFGSAAEPEILPGGGGAAYRLAPGRPMQQALPQKTSAPGSLRVLACTGGLLAPAVAPTLDEALAKARAGKPRPAIMQGVVSECVEVKTALPARPAGTDMPKRSLRQKGSQSPVNMTGAAGREAGLPVPASPAKDLP